MFVCLFVLIFIWNKKFKKKKIIFTWASVIKPLKALQACKKLKNNFFFNKFFLANTNYLPQSLTLWSNSSKPKTKKKIVMLRKIEK